MKKFLATALLFAAVFALPFLLLPPPDTDAAETSRTSTSATTTVITEEVGVSSQTGEEYALPGTVKVLSDGEIVEYELEELVACIVAAEMPALWPVEALKAQAVAARTYVVYRCTLPYREFGEADLCDDPSRCCAVADLDALAVSWGEHGPDYVARVKSAVASTAGEILLYDEQPIMAVFHAMSGEYTSSCADVWGGDIPYLVQVAAPAGEKALSNWISTVAVDADDFAKAVKAKYPLAGFSGLKENWVKITATAGSGLVKSVNVGGVSLSGGAMRSICGLKSANFTVKFDGIRFIFTAKGYGHGVGMSQYGAMVMANDGQTYDDILAHYYVGTELKKY